MKPGATLLHPDMAYAIVGVCFEVHNEIGRYGREKQYCDLMEKKFQLRGMPYIREHAVADTGNRLDFFEDYYQLQRYLQIIDVDLGLLINFRQEYLRPKRVLKLEKDAYQKLLARVSSGTIHHYYSLH